MSSMAIDGTPENNTETTILQVETLINYKFKNKKLLEEALTHSSCTESPSYQRLEFVGDAVLGLVFANLLYLGYQDLDPGTLSVLRAANISTEKLARVSVKRGLYRFVRHNAIALNSKVQEFAEAVEAEDGGGAVYGGAVKAPKVLADIVESVVAAVYIDCGFDLIFLWQVIRGLFEPIITPETLPSQPVTMLFELCQKQGKQVDIKHWRKMDKNICNIFIDGKLISSGTSDQKDIAKLNAAKEALRILNETVISHMGVVCEVNEFNEVVSAKQKLFELCSKKKWSKPCYSVQKEVGPAHDRKYICSVEIKTPNKNLFMTGEERTRVRDAENSSASLMIHSLVQSNYV